MKLGVIRNRHRHCFYFTVCCKSANHFIADLDQTAEVNKADPDPASDISTLYLALKATRECICAAYFELGTGRHECI